MEAGCGGGEVTPHTKAAGGAHIAFLDKALLFSPLPALMVVVPTGDRGKIYSFESAAGISSPAQRLPCCCLKFFSFPGGFRFQNSLLLLMEEITESSVSL